MSASSLISQLNGLSLGSPSFLSGAQRFPSASSSRAFRPAYAPLSIEAAHKKGTGSTKNGRDSNSKSRGVKVYGDQYAKAGSIIIRQCGTHIHPGKNVGLGKDYTIFSLIDGVVKFEKKDAKRKKVSVYPKVPTDLTIPVDNRRTRQAKYFHDRRVERKIAMGLLEAPTSEGEALPVAA